VTHEDVTILVVDDQPEHLRAVRMLLEGAGYSVVLCSSAAAALAAMEERPATLVLADVAMPQMNGYQLLEEVRRHPEWDSVAFVFLTARALDSDIRYGKSLGVDDYLTKPIQPEDLLAVIAGKLRRYAQIAAHKHAAGHHEAAPELTIGPLQVDPERHRASLAGHPLALSPRELVLLTCLARHAGSVIPARELVHATHGLATEDGDEARELVRPLIRSLRQKLGQAPGAAGSIETVRGVGYRMVEDESAG
jgi:DNA-binding response OmpR family regulator